MVMRKIQRRGQTLMEYIVLIALLAIASIPIVRTVGRVIRANLLESADALSGENTYNEDRGTMVEGARKKVYRTMKDFGHDN